MPLFGRKSNNQLDALLPNILQKAKTPPPRRYYWWQGVQLMVAMTCMFGVLLMVPFIIQDAADTQDADAWSPNVPIDTATPEFGNAVAVAKETEIPPFASRVMFSALRQPAEAIVIYDRPLILQCQASPVPMPLESNK